MGDFEKNQTDTYYRSICPWGLLCKWLTYNDVRILGHREFSKNIYDGFENKEMFIRYRGFKAVNSVNYDLACISNNAAKTIKIDVGPLYKDTLVGHKSGDYHKIWKRELVFDIDLTDYSDVRTCCKGANICNSCWKFMVIACKVMKYIMQQFGYEKILYVFSGRRGIHIWVCDKEAMKLNAAARRNISSFINVKSSSKTYPTFINTDIHYMLKDAVKLVEEDFDELCKTQHFFTSKSHKEKFLNIFPENAQKFIKKILDIEGKSNFDYWQDIKSYYEKTKFKRTIWKDFELSHLIILLAFPRLDVGVTSSPNHLLKMPFSIHPATRKLALVIDFDKIGEFSVNDVPVGWFPGCNDYILSGNILKANPVLVNSIKTFEKFIDSLENNSVKKI